jgi:DNA-binding MarR family transcriptional regulator
MATKDVTLVEQWRDLQGRYLKTSAAIERELSANHDIGLSEFEILDLVAEMEDPSSPCRMKELGTLTPITQSALSRVIDRLEKAGLVTRAFCPEDRRALTIFLTDAGRELHREAAKTHRRILTETL